MKTIITGAAHPANIGEKFNPKIQKITKSASKRIGFESEIETAESCFKILREIEFMTLRIC